MLGMDFKVIVSDCDESFDDNPSPDRLVRRLALLKAKAVANTLDSARDYIVIGADTVVCDGEHILGKPQSEADAKSTLLSLSGRAHSVWTGIALVGREKYVVDAVETKVVFGNISEAEANFYVGTKEPMDKAGSYAVQGIGGFFVNELHGDYYNVVGLPIARLRELLETEFGLVSSEYIGKVRRQ